MAEFVGHQSRTPDGYLQVTTGGIYWRYEGLIDPGSTGWIGERVTSFKEVFVAGYSLADQPVAALSSASGSFATIVAAAGGINIRVTRIGSDPVMIYLFTNRRPTDPGMGAVMYDANQKPVWSALTPTLNPIGVFDNAGYVGLPLAGRSCAHISQRRAATTELIFTAGNLGSCTYSGTSGTPTAGYDIRRQDRDSATLVRCQGATVSAHGATFLGSSTPFQCSTSPTPPSGAASVQSKYRSVIIDVTNF